MLKKMNRDTTRDKYCTHNEGGIEINRWSYAFDGTTLDGRKLRVGVSVKTDSPKPLLLVTVIDL